VPVDLGQVVSQAMDLFRSDGRCAHLSVAVHLAPVTVMADPMRLEQVVANLVENACRYTPPGGSLTIRVAPDGDHGVLETIDTGHGIRPESLARVFEPFAQTGHPSEREHGGLGLGLSVVRQIVELHGGQVSASSEGPGRGARFVVRLPRAQPDAGRPIRQPDRGVGAEPALR
jgi:signal transduction histidine kinase